MAGVFLGDNHIRIAHEGTFDVTTWAMIHYFSVPGGITSPTSAQINTLCDQLIADFDTNICNYGHVSNQVHHVRSKLKLVDGASNTFRTVRPSSGQGTSATTPEAGQCCYLFNWSTGDPRRGGKARSYMPGVTTGEMADRANITSGVVTAWATQLANYITAVNARSITGQPLFFVEMSFFNNKAPRAAGTGYQILSGTCSNAVATQRRRVDRLRVT